MTERIVWQPFALYQPGSDFGIYIDRNFAREMLETKLSLEDRIRVKQLLLEVSERFGFNHPEPVDFHEDTAFIKGFYLCSGGVWLTADGLFDPLSLKENIREPVKYSSHNVNNSKQAYALMALIDWWAEYADTIKSLTLPAV